MYKINGTANINAIRAASDQGKRGICTFALYNLIFQFAVLTLLSFWVLLLRVAKGGQRHYLYVLRLKETNFTKLKSEQLVTNN